MRGKWLLRILSAAVVVLIAGTSAEARGRSGSSSPFVMTPFGPIPKSVYNAPFVQNPATLERYRQAEQNYWSKYYGTGSTKKPTAKKKPATTKKQ